MLAAPLWLVLGGLLLAGCADVTEDLNPANWGSEDTEPVPGENEDFPNLGSVPDKPDDITPIEVIEQVEQSLLADSANAKHTASSEQRVDDETTPEPMPEVVEEVEVDEDVVVDEEVETEDGTTEDVIIDENVETDEIIEDGSGDSDSDGDGAALEVVEPYAVALAEPVAVIEGLALTQLTGDDIDIDTDGSLVHVARGEPDGAEQRRVDVYVTI